MGLDLVRKIGTVVEDVWVEGGRPVQPRTRIAAAGAVVDNPLAGRFVDDLEPLIDRLSSKGSHSTSTALASSAASTSCDSRYEYGQTTS